MINETIAVAKLSEAKILLECNVELKPLVDDINIIIGKINEHVADEHFKKKVKRY